MRQWERQDHLTDQTEGVTSQESWDTLWDVMEEHFRLHKTYYGLVRHPQDLAARGTRRSRAAAKETVESGSQMRPGGTCLCVRTCMLMCLHRKQWGNPRYKASYRMEWMSEPSYWKDPLCLRVRTHSEAVCTSSWSGSAASGACTARCQQLGCPEASSYWVICVSVPS